MQSLRLWKLVASATKINGHPNLTSPGLYPFEALAEIFDFVAGLVQRVPKKPSIAKADLQNSTASQGDCLPLVFMEILRLQRLMPFPLRVTAFINFKPTKKGSPKLPLIFIYYSSLNPPLYRFA